ncbi:MAG: antitoxin [Candidatus Avispirillum sp.]
MQVKKSHCGRPAGRKKTAKIEVVIEPSVKEEFMKIISDEGKTASVEIGSWIRAYIKKVNTTNN